MLLLRALGRGTELQLPYIDIWCVYIETIPPFSQGFVLIHPTHMIRWFSISTKCVYFVYILDTVNYNIARSLTVCLTSSSSIKWIEKTREAFTTFDIQYTTNRWKETPICWMKIEKRRNKRKWVRMNKRKWFGPIEMPTKSWHIQIISSSETTYIDIDLHLNYCHVHISAIVYPFHSVQFRLMPFFLRHIKYSNWVIVLRSRFSNQIS